MVSYLRNKERTKRNTIFTSQNLNRYIENISLCRKLFEIKVVKNNFIAC